MEYTYIAKEIYPNQMSYIWDAADLWGRMLLCTIGSYLQLALLRISRKHLPKFEVTGSVGSLLYQRVLTAKKSAMFAW